MLCTNQLPSLLVRTIRYVTCSSVPSRVAMSVTEMLPLSKLYPL